MVCNHFIMYSKPLLWIEFQVLGSAVQICGCRSKEKQRSGLAQPGPAAGLSVSWCAPLCLLVCAAVGVVCTVLCAQSHVHPLEGWKDP